MAYFSLMAKVELLHVPYKGTVQALIDLLAGQTSTVFTGIPSILPHVQKGKLRVIGVSTEKRLPSLPDVPTISESGLPGFEVIQWWGLLAPAGTPRSVVMKLNQAMAKALQSADMRNRMAADGTDPVGSTPEEFHALIKNEIARWAPVIKASGAQPN